MITLTKAADPVGRERGRYEQHMYSTGYDVQYDSTWVTSPNGKYIRSTLKDSHLHAPIYDVDQPVTATATASGTNLQFAPVSRRRMRQSRRRLQRLGVLDPATPEALGSLTLTLPIRAVPSRTAGHVHLYVDVPMSFDRTVKLAKALACLVDPRHIRISRKSKAWLAHLA